MVFLLSSLLLASAATVSAQSFTLETTRTRTSTALGLPTATPNLGEPCGRISEAVQEGEVRFSPQDAFDCLNSVPVDKEGNGKLIDELKFLWQWQSDGGWLKKAPQSWELGTLDIEKELDNIKSNLDNFKSEYEVQLAIQNITIRSGNFHFNYRPDITRVFRFWRRIGVASISSDGKELPKLYVESDARTLAASSSSGISEIDQINGKNAYEYLEEVANLEQFLDKDSRIANVYTPGDTESYGAFEVQGFFHGNSTEVKFKNGSTATYENYARIGPASSAALLEFNSTSAWSSVSDGPTFFETFCTGAFTGDVFADSLGTANGTKSFDVPIAELLDDRPVHDGKVGPGKGLRRRQSIPDTYPTPVVVDESEVVAGYFLEGEGYNDVAVLKIVSFSPEEDASGEDFQATVQSFLKKSTDEKKQKLVIDLRENGGGMIQLYLDTFKQLFPKDAPFSGQYFRAQDQYLAIGDAVSKFNDAGNGRESIQEDLESLFYFWSWWSYINGKGETFKTWDDFNGPVDLNGDKFTTLFQWSLENNRRNVLLSPGFSFYNDTNANPPFEAKNIVLLTDGLCGSACAAFAENMKNLAGVKTVVVGGRSEAKAMQGVAGSKGGQVVPMAMFPMFAKLMFEASSSSTVDLNLNNTKVKDLADLSQVLIRAGDEFNRVQIKEHLRKGDSTGTPLEFQYEAADCKFFYTAKSWEDPKAVWTQAWDAFNDDTKCVEGSTKHESSLSGGFKPFGTGEVKDENLPKPNGTANQEQGGGKKGAASSLKASGAVFAMVIAVALSML